MTASPVQYLRCIKSSLKIVSLDSVAIANLGNGAKQYLIRDGTLNTAAGSKPRVKFNGTDAIVSSKIVAPSIFAGISTAESMEGQVIGMAVLESESGSSNIEADFFASIQLISQLQSDAPTSSTEPSVIASANPSVLTSDGPSLIKSDQPSMLPSGSISPTVLKHASVSACQCDELLKCQDKPLFLSTPVKICLKSQPQFFTFESVEQLGFAQGDEGTVIVSGGAVADLKTTSMRKSDERMFVIDTVIPDQFLSNPDLVVTCFGTGSIVQMGLVSIPRHISFVVEFTVLDEPSSAPSGLPSEAPSDSLEVPAVITPSPSSSFMPSEVRTISFTSCPCNNEDECLSEPLRLSWNDRLMRICLQATPSNAAVMSMSFTSTSPANKASLEYTLDGSTGIIFGSALDEAFMVGQSQEMKVLGVLEISVGNRQSDFGFMAMYKLDALTATPTTAPSTSLAPSDEPPIGVIACQCTEENVCTISQKSFRSRLLRVCIRSTPPQFEIFEIISLFLQSMNEAGVPFEQLVIMNDKAYTEDVVTSTISPMGLDFRSRVVVTQLRPDFFETNGPRMVSVQGVATVRSPVSEAQHSLFFQVTPDVIIVNEPSSQPSHMPSYYPSVSVLFCLSCFEGIIRCCSLLLCL